MSHGRRLYPRRSNDITPDWKFGSVLVYVSVIHFIEHLLLISEVSHRPGPGNTHVPGVISRDRETDSHHL